MADPVVALIGGRFDGHRATLTATPAVIDLTKEPRTPGKRMRGEPTGKESTMTESTCTEDQRAEWNALMTAASTLTERSRERERDAGYTLRWAIDNPISREWAEREAWRLARGSRRAWLARVRLLALAEAHPYGREVRARLNAAREAAA